MTDAEGEQGVLAQALRRPIGNGAGQSGPMAIRTPREVGGQIRHSGTRSDDEPEARRGTTWGIRPGPGKKKNKRGGATCPAAPTVGR